jgi:hypothetical protein
MERRKVNSDNAFNREPKAAPTLKNHVSTTFESWSGSLT